MHWSGGVPSATLPACGHENAICEPKQAATPGLLRQDCHANILCEISTSVALASLGEEGSLPCPRGRGVEMAAFPRMARKIRHGKALELHVSTGEVEVRLGGEIPELTPQRAESVVSAAGERPPPPFLARFILFGLVIVILQVFEGLYLSETGRGTRVGVKLRPYAATRGSRGS